MAKRTKSRDKQTSKGQRPSVNRKILNAVRKEQTPLDRMANAWIAWKRGCPTPKLIQKSLGVDKKTLYRTWNKYIPLKSSDER